MFWIFPLLCLIFMVAMMFMMFRRRGAGCLPFGRGARTGNGGETPAQILDRRYARRADHQKEQYQAIRRDVYE